MPEPGPAPSADRLRELPVDEATERVRGWLQAVETADAAVRKQALREARELAEARPAAFDGLESVLSRSLHDDDRAVRLTTAKLFVSLAATAPDIVVPSVDDLADRLADDTEFYYVRARCAEALGYVALEHPEPVSDPEILADFRIGLSFDEPEVKEKLAKALEYVALGNPSRLRHHVGSLADHLDDGNELVRYHLCTALVGVGCLSPDRLGEAEGALRDRLTDENPYVRGRAAEALGLLAASAGDAARPEWHDELDEAILDEPPEFLTARVRFARDGPNDDDRERFGTVAAVRESTETAVEELTTPDGSACPHCGLEMPEDGPPMCPRCGAPR